MEELKKKPGIGRWAPLVIVGGLLALLVAWMLNFPW